MDEDASKPAELLEKIGKGAIALSAVGYLSLNAQYNSLGYHPSAPDTIQTYLQELNFLLWTTVATVFVPLLPFALIVAGIDFVLRRRASARAEIAAPEVPAPTLAARVWILFPISFALLVWIVYFVVLQVFGHAWSTGGASAQVVGPIDADSIKKWQCAAHSKAPGLGLLVFGVSAACVDLLRRSRAIRGLPFPDRFAWMTYTASLVFLALHIPLIVGANTVDPEYPTVSITTGDQRVSGLLLNQSAETVDVWQLKGRSGVVSVYRADDLEELEIGAPQHIRQYAVDQLTAQQPGATASHKDENDHIAK